MEPKAPARPLRVPRRTPRACKQCRAAKIKCSSTVPCERCVRRGDTCVFPPDEPHVSIPESYLKHLERVASSAKNSSNDTTHDVNPPVTNVSPQRRPPEAQDNGSPLGSMAAQRPPDTRRQVSRLQQQTTPQASQQGDDPPSRVASSPGITRGTCINVVTAGEDVESQLQPRSPAPSQVDINSLSGASSFLPSHMPVVPVAPSGDAAQDSVHNDSGVGPPHNPLVSRRLSYIRDTKGRPRYLGPTSTWSFCRRALALLEEHTPSPGGPHATAPLNLDGTAFRLKWTVKPSIEASDFIDLPAADYAHYLYSSVRFHFGELFGMVDDHSFSELLNRFHTDQQDIAGTNRLWFVQYLLIIAFGKAFLEHSSTAAVPGQRPPGSNYAARAMSLMPDAAQMHEEALPAIEALALAALYFQAIDMRAVAYQYIGQAIRLSHIEGIYRQIDDDADAINAPFASRCNSLWWTVYILDQEMSSSQGLFTSLSEEDITAALPSERCSSLTAKALSLRVHLARVRGSAYTCILQPLPPLLSCVESAGILDDTFIKGTTYILHQLADISRKLDETISNIKHSIQGDLPYMIRRLMLPYHHCIVLITRPLAMWLLINSLPPADSTAQHLAHPIASLLQTSAESATSITNLVANMADNDMLETFLPFELEYLFSSAMLLSILDAIIPNYILDVDWRRKTMKVLDVMIRKSSTVAPLRKAELEQLETLLGAVEQHHSSRNILSQHPNYPLLNPGVPQPMSPPRPAASYSRQRGGPPLTMDSSSFAVSDESEAAATSMVLDGMCGPTGDQILGLAEQFEMEDLDINFTIME